MRNTFSLVCFAAALACGTVAHADTISFAGTDSYVMPTTTANGHITFGDINGILPGNAIIGAP